MGYSHEKFHEMVATCKDPNNSKTNSNNGRSQQQTSSCSCANGHVDSITIICNGKAESVTRWCTPSYPTKDLQNWLGCAHPHLFPQCGITLKYENEFAGIDSVHTLNAKGHSFNGFISKTKKLKIKKKVSKPYLFFITLFKITLHFTQLPLS